MAAVVRDQFPGVVWWCPQLPPSPQLAVQSICDGTADWPASMAVVGSSLGGFYATTIAEQKCCKAVLLNPAVEPARDLAKYIGELTNWHDPHESFYFKPEFIQELRALEAGSLKRPENYLAIIAKGDEVLSWRGMSARYAGARVKLIEDSDHALSDFDQHLPDILDFLNLSV